MTINIKIAYPIEDAFDLIGVTRTRGFQLIATGELATYKVGKRRLATHKALEACVEKLARKSTGAKAA